MCQVVHVADLPEEILDDVGRLLIWDEPYDEVPDDLLSDGEFMTAIEPVIAVESSAVSESGYDVALAQDAGIESTLTVTPVHAV